MEKMMNLARDFRDLLCPEEGGSRGLITGAGGNFGISMWRLHIPRGQTVCRGTLAFDNFNAMFGSLGILTMQPKRPQPPPHPKMEQPPLQEKIPQVQNMLRGPVISFQSIIIKKKETKPYRSSRR